MLFAEVSVNSPIARRRTFSYSIPPGMNIGAGQAVRVPFGSKTLQGVVIALSPFPAVEETKEIADCIDPQPVLSPAQIYLARWISDYYLSPLFDAVALMLPPGFERRAVTFISPSNIPADFDLSSLSVEQRNALELIKSKDKLGFSELEKDFGKKKAQSLTSQLVKLGLAIKSYELEREKVRPKMVSYLRLAVSVDKAREESDKLYKSRALKQAGLLSFLIEQPGSVLLTEVKDKTGSNRAVADALISKGLVTIEQVQVKREPISHYNLELSLPLPLTSAQQTAFEAIRTSLHGNINRKARPDVFLLHGVTGSGKTEVYLQALAEAVKLGKRGIVLVPEIALTPQTIERFGARFPQRVAVLHSGLSLGEQYDEWQGIKNGEYDVVIGPRSAVFSPQPDLGLIVIDEEHEWTYKQEENSPRYHARDVALKLAELTGVTVILGSATPDVVSYYRAQTGRYSLLQLPERVTPSEGSPLPQVEVVDMREELKSGNRSIFSRSLSETVSRALSGKEQVILFLNRRGASSFVQCRSCGFVMRCRRCNVPLGYHSDSQNLVCHQCNLKTAVPQACPQCHSRKIKYVGAGTQKLEEETSIAFPSAGLLRWDSDVTGRSMELHRRILNEFRDHKADILIGTQMVAKGLDLPGVTVVGVVNADTALHLPDFRAGERTFQLLSQVAGRAGRGTLGGRVIIQTYSPEHYSIRSASKHDYSSFYNKEIEYRRELHNPPFSQLALLVYGHTNEGVCQREAQRVRRVLETEMKARGIAGLTVIGPAPSFIPRLRGRYRCQMVLRGSDLSVFLSELELPRGWTIDIDPASVI